ncbi:MAG: isochorismatase family cysteine hydrolase [Candidatus Roizmanbacteria bacterium]
MIKAYPEMNADNTCLLVIDIINSCCHEKCEIPEWNIHFSKIRQIVPYLDTFIESYRSQINNNIILTSTVPWQLHVLPNNINTLYLDPKTTYYSKDQSGFAEKFYGITPKETDLVISKNSYSAFTNSSLNTYLQENQIKYIVITGVFADGCVLASIVDGFAKGYNFVILEDLIETTDVPIRQELQKSLKLFTWPIMYGQTITSKEFLSSF